MYDSYSILHCLYLNKLLGVYVSTIQLWLVGGAHTRGPGWSGDKKPRQTHRPHGRGLYCADGCHTPSLPPSLGKQQHPPAASQLPTAVTPPYAIQGLPYESKEVAAQ